MVRRRPYRSKFDFVSDVIWLALCIAAITATAIFAGGILEDREIGYLVLVPVLILLRFPARWLSRRLGIDEE